MKNRIFKPNNTQEIVTLITTNYCKCASSFIFFKGLGLQWLVAPSCASSLSCSSLWMTGKYPGVHIARKLSSHPQDWKWLDKQDVRAKFLQSCSTLCDPINCSLPGSSMGFSRDGLPCPPPGNFPHSRIQPCIAPALTGEFFTTSTSWEAPVNSTRTPICA